MYTKHNEFEILEKELIPVGNFAEWFNVEKLKIKDTFRQVTNKAFFITVVFEDKTENLSNYLNENIHDSRLFEIIDTNKENTCYFIFKGLTGIEEINTHNQKVNKIKERFVNENKVRVENNKRNELFEGKEIYLSAFKKSNSPAYATQLSILIYELQNRNQYLFSGIQNVETSIDRYDLDLDVSFQRDHVWTIDQKRALIRSLFLDMPIGNFYINRVPIFDRDVYRENNLSEIDNVVFDGKQRLSAILEYLNGDFSVHFEGHDIFAYNIEESVRNRIFSKTVNVYETEFSNLNDLIDYYVLINSNQTKHSQEEIDKALSFKK